MTNIVERLSASKEKHLQEAERLGLKAGRAWASNTAEYGELLRVANFWDSSRCDINHYTLKAVMDSNNDLSPEGFRDLVGCTGFETSEEFAEGFAHGATEVYDEVEDEMGKQTAAENAAETTHE